MYKITSTEEGFTLIGVIVTIAIVLALAVGGFVSYGNLAEQAKRAATEAAAQQVYDAANVFNHEKSKTPTEASNEFNQRHEVVTTSVTGENCVTATHENGYTTTRGTGCSSAPPTPNPAGNAGLRAVVEGKFVFPSDEWSSSPGDGGFTVKEVNSGRSVHYSRNGSDYKNYIGAGDEYAFMWYDSAYKSGDSYIVTFSLDSGQTWEFEIADLLRYDEDLESGSDQVWLAHGTWALYPDGSVKRVGEPAPEM